MAQPVGCLTSAQVMISQFVGLSPASGSALTAQILEPASDSVSPALSAPPPLVLSLCLSKINKCKKKLKKKRSSTQEDSSVYDLKVTQTKALTFPSLDHT